MANLLSPGVCYTATSDGDNTCAFYGNSQMLLQKVVLGE